MTEPRKYDFREGHQDPDAKHLGLRQGHRAPGHPPVKIERPAPSERTRRKVARAIEAMKEQGERTKAEAQKAIRSKPQPLTTAKVATLIYDLLVAVNHPVTRTDLVAVFADEHVPARTVDQALALLLADRNRSVRRHTDHGNQTRYYVVT